MGAFTDTFSCPIKQAARIPGCSGYQTGKEHDREDLEENQQCVIVGSSQVPWAVSELSKQKGARPSLVFRLLGSV